MRIRDFFSDRASYAQQQLSASRISRDNQENMNTVLQLQNFEFTYSRYQYSMFASRLADRICTKLDFELHAVVKKNELVNKLYGNGVTLR